MDKKIKSSLLFIFKIQFTCQETMEDKDVFWHMAPTYLQKCIPYPFQSLCNSCTDLYQAMTHILP